MKNDKLSILCEGAIMVALSIALSYLKIPIGVAFGGFGGSIDLVMIPLIIFALRRGTFWGLGAGLIFGTIKYFVAGGTAINWQSMLLDYSVAYMFVGFAGLMTGKKGFAALGALIGCLARFAVHFLSGITIYAIIAPEEILGLTTSSSVIFSILYNGSYMLPNTIIAVIVVALLQKPLSKLAAKAA